MEVRLHSFSMCRVEWDCRIMSYICYLSICDVNYEFLTDRKEAVIDVLIFINKIDTLGKISMKVGAADRAPRL